MYLQPICTLIQFFIAVIGTVLNIFSFFGALGSPTIHKQMYSYFIVTIDCSTIIYCITLMLTMPGYVSDNGKAVLYFANFADFNDKFLKLSVFANLLATDFIMQVYALFFGSRLVTAFMRRYYPQNNIGRTSSYLVGATVLLFLWTAVYITLYGQSHWRTPVASEYEASNATYLIYEVNNVAISSSFGYISLTYYEASMFISIGLVFLFHFILTHILDPGAGGMESYLRQGEALCYMHLQALITFLCLSPIVIFRYFGLNNRIAETLLYTMQSLFVLIVPFYNYKIPYWREPCYCCATPEPAPNEIQLIER